MTDAGEESERMSEKTTMDEVSRLPGAVKRRENDEAEDGFAGRANLSLQQC